MDHFKKSLELQRKQQSELQMQLKKLEESTKTEFQELHKEISERVNYLTELFKSDSNQQNKEFEYLELQNTTLHDEHDRLNEMVNSIMGRTEETENNVGIWFAYSLPTIDSLSQHSHENQPMMLCKNRGLNIAQ